MIMAWIIKILKGGTQTRTGGKDFADLCLTTWLCRQNNSLIIITGCMGSFASCLITKTTDLKKLISLKMSQSA